jgi:hypothetical protein
VLLLTLGVFGTANADYFPLAHRAIAVDINVYNGPLAEWDLAIIEVADQFLGWLVMRPPATGTGVCARCFIWEFWSGC